MHGANRNANTVFVGKPEGKGPLGRHRSTWENNIKTDMREIRWSCMNWIDLRIRVNGGLL
jgi:hypothetical protein